MGMYTEGIDWKLREYEEDRQKYGDDYHKKYSENRIKSDNEFTYSDGRRKSAYHLV